MSRCGAVDTDDEPEHIPGLPQENGGVAATALVSSKKGGCLPHFAEFMALLMGLSVHLAILAVLWGAHIRNKSSPVKEDSPTVIVFPDADSSSDMSRADAATAEDTFDIGMTIDDEEIGHNGILL